MKRAENPLPTPISPLGTSFSKTFRWSCWLFDKEYTEFLYCDKLQIIMLPQKRRQNMKGSATQIPSFLEKGITYFDSKIPQNLVPENDDVT